jgi:hypothetical protein
LIKIEDGRVIMLGMKVNDTWKAVRTVGSINKEHKEAQ